MFLNNLPSQTFWQQILLSYSNLETCILIRAVPGFRVLQVPLFHATWLTNTFPFEFSHQQFHDYPKKGDGDLSEICHEKLFHSDAVETELPGIAPSGRIFLLRWRDGEACVADKRSALGSDFCWGSEEMEGHCYHRLRSPQNWSSFASYMYCGTWFSNRPRGTNKRCRASANGWKSTCFWFCPTAWCWKPSSETGNVPIFHQLHASSNNPSKVTKQTRTQRKETGSSSSNASQYADTL